MQLISWTTWRNRTLSASNKVGQLSASSCCRDLESARRFPFFPFAIVESYATYFDSRTESAMQSTDCIRKQQMKLYYRISWIFINLVVARIILKGCLNLKLLWYQTMLITTLWCRSCSLTHYSIIQLNITKLYVLVSSTRKHTHRLNIVLMRPSFHDQSKIKPTLNQEPSS